MADIDDFVDEVGGIRFRIEDTSLTAGNTVRRKGNKKGSGVMVQYSGQILLSATFYQDKVILWKEMLKSEEFKQRLFWKPGIERDMTDALLSEMNRAADRELQLRKDLDLQKILYDQKVQENAALRKQLRLLFKNYVEPFTGPTLAGYDFSADDEENDGESRTSDADHVPGLPHGEQERADGVVGEGSEGSSSSDGSEDQHGGNSG